VVDETPDPQSLKWWLKRLEDELAARMPDMQGFRDLVDDIHPQPDSVETTRKFRRIAGLATTNLTGLAVEATAERMSVEGIRIGDEPEADKSFWDNVWQRSDFDAGSQDAITGALVYSRSMISVEPPSATSPYAKLHYEDPRQVVLSYLPDGSRGPALKLFTDEWTGTTYGTLYTRDYIIKMERAGTPEAGNTRWLPRPMVGNEQVVSRNPLGEVPFFELQNKLTGSIRSEVAPLVIPQLRLNQIVFNTDSVAEYGAFRQKWATNIEVPRAPDGTPITPFEANISKLFVAEGNGSFGNFDVTDMAPYINLGQDAAAHIARLSRVPITYFLSNVSNLGGDALALLISGLVRKCQRRVTGYEPAIEGAARLALRSMGDARADAANIEVKWADMETRSPAQSADAALKLTQGDNPVITVETAQEKYLGMAQTERARDASRRAAPSLPGAEPARVP
jgi:hypothetical protein